MARSSETKLIEKIKDAFSRIVGSYAMVIVTRDQLIDYATRTACPLCLGRNGDTYYLVRDLCIGFRGQIMFERWSAAR